MAVLLFEDRSLGFFPHRYFSEKLDFNQSYIQEIYAWEL